MALKVAIIAGHMYETAGKRSVPFSKDVDIDGDGVFDIKKGTQFREHCANVGVSVEMDKAFRRCGVETVPVGWNDANPTDDTLPCDTNGLIKRQQLVKAAHCDYSFSNHFNAFGDGRTYNAADGICVYMHSVAYKAGNSAPLARMVMDELIKGTKQRNRDVHSDAFAEVNCAAMGVKGALLMEYAFMTNQHEAEELMASKLYWIECAEEVVRGFCKFVGIPYVERKDEEMEVKTITAVINGTDKPLKAINFGNENYVRLRDLADVDLTDALKVDWDATAGKVIINTK